MEKIVCIINTPTHKYGELVDRYDLEVDRLDFPDMYQSIKEFRINFKFQQAIKCEKTS